MSDASANSPQDKSWLARISDAIFREPQDKKDLIALLQAAQARHVLDENALEMMEGVLEVSSLQVRDIMIPRSQMAIISRDEPLSVFITKVIKSGHSRFPVIGEDKDDIRGILLAKDLLPYLFNGKEKSFNIDDITRPATFVPESKRLNVLLNEFRVSHNHMAIVVDEYGGIAGLVTIEDVLEEIVGEISDEHDISQEEAQIQKTGHDEFTVKSLTPIEAFNNYFASNFSDEEFDTIGGLIANGFGYMPSIGETLQMEGFFFTISRANKRKIQLITVKKLTANSKVKKNQAD